MKFKTVLHCYTFVVLRKLCLPMQNVTLLSRIPPILTLECLQLRYFNSTVVTNACLTGGMDTEIADTVRYITLLQTLFSTWELNRVYRTCYTLVHFVHTVQMLHPYYPIRCGETRLIGIISGQSNQKQSKLRTSLPYMGRNIDCYGQNVPVCHASRKTLMCSSTLLYTLTDHSQSSTSCRVLSHVVVGDNGDACFPSGSHFGLP